MTLTDLVGITLCSLVVLVVLHLNGLLVAQTKEIQLRCSSPMSNVAKKPPSSQWVRS